MKVLPVAILCGLLFGAFGVLSVIWCVVSVVRCEPLTAIVVAGVAVFCFAFIVPFAKIVPGNVKPQVEVDRSGTVFRPDLGVDVPIQVALTGLVVASGLFAIFAPLHRLDIPIPTEMRFYLPFVGALAALSGAAVLVRSLLRGSSKLLRLTPDGFAIVQGWRSQNGTWNQVRDVTDAVPEQSAATRGAIVIVTTDGFASMAAGSITPDGHALRELVRFYWQHPERRDELVVGGALDRLSGE